MSTIHGASHKAISLFRKSPAALSVYWIYCARRNHDGIAFPSLRGLAHDTGWSVNPCKKARDWLVKNSALEKLDRYVRPQWRKLDQAEQARLVNLDKSEYYRVTGIIILDGKTYDMLYAPSSDASDVSHDDVSPEPTSALDDTSHGTTSDAGEHRRGDTELDLITDHDSITPQLNSNSKEKEKEKADPVIDVPDDPAERKARAKAIIEGLEKQFDGNLGTTAWTPEQMADFNRRLEEKYGDKANGKA